jgi:hypothetical protein
MELADQCRQSDPLDTSADRIWADLLFNREVSPKRRRYSVESLFFSREIHDISAAYQVISRILPLPSDRLLRAKFLHEKFEFGMQCSICLNLRTSFLFGKQRPISVPELEFRHFLQWMQSRLKHESQFKKMVLLKESKVLIVWNLPIYSHNLCRIRIFSWFRRDALEWSLLGTFVFQVQPI